MTRRRSPDVLPTASRRETSYICIYIYIYDAINKFTILLVRRVTGLKYALDQLACSGYIVCGERTVAEPRVGAPFTYVRQRQWRKNDRGGRRINRELLAAPRALVSGTKLARGLITPAAAVRRRNPPPVLSTRVRVTV